MTEDSSESVSRLCCHCLVQLVFEEHAEFDYILSGLLNAVPSARWVKHHVWVVLLVHQTQDGCLQMVAAHKSNQSLTTSV